MKFAQKLKLLRTNAAETQTSLAAVLQKRYHCNITREDIANWEVGRHQPKWPEAIILSKFFKVSLDDLFRDDKNDFFKQLRTKLFSIAA